MLTRESFGTGGRRYPRHHLACTSDVPAELLQRDDQTSFALQRKIERLRYDDRLSCGHWALEYLYLDSGLIHYRLYYGRQLIGLVDVNAESLLATVQRYLASYLCWLGWRAETVVLTPAGAITYAGAPKKRVPVLFRVTSAESQQRKLQRQERSALRPALA